MRAEQLLQRCAWQADRHFRLHGDLRSVLWLTSYRDGQHEFSESMCCAPDDVDDATALDALRAEMAADFRREGVVGYAVAYSAKVTFIGVGLAILAHPPTVRRRAVTIEAHDAAESVIGICDIVAGDRPQLGALQRSVRATGRFGGLIDRAS
jgi:hypothetical protein